MNEKRILLKDRLKEALEIRGKKAADLSKDLDIPKSAISQYLSGKSQNMDSERMYSICRYLNVNEAWMLGFNVPMDREIKKKNDTMSSIVIRMQKDYDFFSLVEHLSSLDEEKIRGVKQMLSAFLK